MAISEGHPEDIAYKVYPSTGIPSVTLFQALVYAAAYMLNNHASWGSMAKAGLGQICLSGRNSFVFKISN